MSDKLEMFPFGEPDRTIKHGGPIILMTEQDKKRDREMIRSYIQKLPDDDFLKNHGGK